MFAFRRPLRFLKRLLPPLNFITIHYTYFITTCLLSAVILWGSSAPAKNLTFIDALFLAVSAMTLAGLNTVNLSTLNTFQQIVLFLLLMLGSAIFVSAFVVHLRRTWFEKKFRSVVEKQQKGRFERGRSMSRQHRHTFPLTSRTASQEEEAEAEKVFVNNESSTNNNMLSSVDATLNATLGTQGDSSIDQVAASNEDVIEKDTADGLPPMQNSGIHFRTDTVFQHEREAVSPAPTQKHYYSFFNAQGVGARPTSSLRVSSASRSNMGKDNNSPSIPPNSRGDISRYFDTVGGWISRNSQFHGLTDRERERLGGYEYRAVKFLSWLVPAYFVLWQLLACLGCAAWVASKRADVTRENGLNPWWVGAFNAVSAFNNSGMSLLDANMVAFQRDHYLLITMGLCILAGNTCYPIFLRLIVWTIYKLIKRWEDDFESLTEHARTLKFLLDHPRRCYTNLFPSRHTWWLLFSVVTLNGIDWAAFEILNIGNKSIDALPVGDRVIDGLFQAFAVRSGGFYVVPISTVRIGLQVLYVVMMYISVYPVVITMRNSNVYEERSLGIYAEDQDDQRQVQQRDNQSFLLRITGHLIGKNPSNESNRNFVRQQLRAQLAHDAWTIFVALFFIMIIETSQFDRDSVNFSVFNFFFEIVSGYGCVGISIGIPWENYSFCGTWHTLSKLILCGVMLKGRHRGLPVAIDRAVLLPGQENEQAEEDDGRIRLARTISRGQGYGETVTVATA